MNKANDLVTLLGVQSLVSLRLALKNLDALNASVAAVRVSEAIAALEEDITKRDGDFFLIDQIATYLWADGPVPQFGERGSLNS